MIDISNGENPDEKLVLINPEILQVEGKQGAKRAASAFPDFASRCGAAKRVTVRAQNAKGESSK